MFVSAPLPGPGDEPRRDVSKLFKKSTLSSTNGDSITKLRTQLQLNLLRSLPMQFVERFVVARSECCSNTDGRFIACCLQIQPPAIIFLGQLGFVLRLGKTFPCLTTNLSDLNRGESCRTGHCPQWQLWAASSWMLRKPLVPGVTQRRTDSAEFWRVGGPCGRPNDCRRPPET